MKRRIIEIIIAVMIIFALSFSSFAMFTYQNKRPVTSSVGTGSSKTSSVTSVSFSNVAEYPLANSDISFSSSKPSSSKISISKKPTSSSSKTSSSIPIVAVTEVKATWISYNELKSFLYNKNQSEFKIIFTDHINKLKAFGINTIIVQVRPFGDAVYKSNLFPWSYLTGEIGKDPKYDPLEIMIDLAHKNGMLIEAWLNPFRAHTEAEAEILAVKYKDLTFSKWYNDVSKKSDYIVKYKDKNTNIERWYLNPGIPEVRTFIIDGVKEIVSKYNVDGIHFDDYFYPTVEVSFDSKAFSTYGGGLSLGDWRRSCVSTLVKDVYSAVKAIKPKVKFGISPIADIAKAKTNQYADLVTWCGAAGYIDYICPQIYFGFLNLKLPFEKTIKDWSNIIKVSGLKFYVGLAPYKTGVYDQFAGEVTAVQARNEWLENSDIIKRQVELLRTIKNCSGFYLFREESIISPKNNIAVQEIDNLKKIM